MTAQEHQQLAAEFGLSAGLSFSELRQLLLERLYKAPEANEHAAESDVSRVSHAYTARWMDQIFHLLHGRSQADIEIAIDALRLFLDRWDAKQAGHE